MVRAIETANPRDEFDVLIVSRGGGSLEDLWSFNDERVVREIFASQIPIVSTVGYETDVTIVDFVIDLHAPIPSAAVELVSRNQLELVRQLRSQKKRLEMAMDYYLVRHQQQFTRIHYYLQQRNIRTCDWRAIRCFCCCSNYNAAWKRVRKINCT